MEYDVKQMDREHGVLISKWIYKEPFSIYSMDGSEECLNELLHGFYFMVNDEDKNLIGYLCFGASARVPAGNLFEVYNDKDCMDIGLGINPALCGQGLGKNFMSCGLDYARRFLAAKRFRLTVASFNTRAVKVYESVGFRKITSFVRKSDGGEVEFWVMTLN